MRFVYTLLMRLLRPLALGWVLWRGFKDRGYWRGLDERFGFGAPSGAASLWLHAVSLGEVTAAGPLVRNLRARHPDVPFVVTTATPTGRARAEQLFGAAVNVRYLPYDTPASMRRFLARARPGLAIVMETELWPNLFRECGRQAVPMVLANARLSTRSVRRYRRFGALFRDVWRAQVVVAAQSLDDAGRFRALGARDVRAVGNLKFDVQVDESVLARGRALRAALWPGRPVWIAGSTHAGEEVSVLTAHEQLCERAADALLLLVPRHPARFDAVADLLKRRGTRFTRRSSDGGAAGMGGAGGVGSAGVVLVDTVGELAALYAAVDVAFVGGSLVPVGGHNLLEAAALGVPVITGPSYANARDVAAALLQAGAALEVTDAAGLAAALTTLFAEPGYRARLGAAGRSVVAANAGSLERLLGIIEPLWATGRAAGGAAPATAR